MSTRHLIFLFVFFFSCKPQGLPRQERQKGIFVSFEDGYIRIVDSTNVLKINFDTATIDQKIIHYHHWDSTGDAQIYEPNYHYDSLLLTFQACISGDCHVVHVLSKDSLEFTGLINHFADGNGYRKLKNKP